MIQPKTKEDIELCSAHRVEPANISKQRYDNNRNLANEHHSQESLWKAQGGKADVAAPMMSFSEMSRIANVLRASLCVMYRAGDCADNAMQYVFEFFSFHMVLRNPRFRPFLIGIMSSNVSEHI